VGPPLQIGASPEQVWKVLQDAKSPMFVILHVGLPILVRQTGERGHELLFVGEMLIHMGVQLSGEGGHFGIVHVVFEEELAFEPLQQLKQPPVFLVDRGLAKGVEVGPRGQRHASSYRGKRSGQAGSEP